MKPESPVTSLAEDARVIDADTHFTEAPDLWTKRAPAGYKDRVLHVEEVEGQPTWVVDGVELGVALGGGVIDRHGEKFPFSESMVVWGLDRVHQAAYDPKTRLEIMDECGIHAQVLFRNTIGLGGQELSRVQPLETIREKMETLRPESRRKILGDNAAKLYRL